MWNFLTSKKEIWVVVGALAGVLLISAVLGGETSSQKDALPTSTINNMLKASQAVIETNMGNITISFLSGKATSTIENFVKLAESNFYDGTKFHRVIKDFMIQTGDPLSKGEDKTLYGRGGPGYTFKDEPNDVLLTKGVVAMVNSGPDTNGSQYFIITAAQTPWLQGAHTPFAKVTAGMDVAERISNVPKDENDVPLQPVVVNRVILK